MSDPEAPAPGGVVSRWFLTTFDALHERNYRMFYIGLAISFTGAWMRRTALGWVVFERTGSYELLGTVFALALLPLLVFSPIAGSLADRMDKRRLIIYSRVLAFVVSSALAVLVWLDLASIPWILGLAFLGGTAFAFEVPTRQAFVVELVGRERLLNAIALNSALVNLTRAIGPVVAGFGMGLIGAHVVFAADAVASVAVIATLATLRLKERRPVEPTGSRLAQLAEGWREVAVNRPVRNMLLLLAVVTMFAWSFDTLMPAIAQEILLLSEEAFGVLMGSFGLGAVVGALYVAGRANDQQPLRQAYGGIALMLLGLLLMTIFRTFWGMVPSMMVAGAGGIAFLSTANTTIQANVEDRIRGRVMGVWTVVFGGATPVGAWVTGHAAAYISPFATIQIFVVITAAATGAVYWWGERRRAGEL